MPTAEEIQEKLQASELKPVYIEVIDASDGCGSKFEAIVVSSSFDGMGLLERQRAVNDVIKAEMDEIHAFSMKTWTPAQYEKKKQNVST